MMKKLWVARSVGHGVLLGAPVTTRRDRTRNFFVLFIINFWLWFSACSPSQFTAWQIETFAKTPITGSVSKTISLRNENPKEVQKVSIGFDSTGDGRQHFRIDRVSVGTRIVGLKDILVPPGTSLNIQVTYQPRNMKTTKADFRGWVTGEEPRFLPYKPGEEPKPPEMLEAWHRVVLLAVYDAPQGGITRIELVGRAELGPNGEIALPEGGVGECKAGEGIACFTGNFAIDIPKLFTTGPKEEALSGPIRFGLTDSKASLKMDDFVPIVFSLKGNGPGEPLEGQPVSEVSIIVKGVPGVEGEGTFDGSQLELQNLSFRIQVVIGYVDPKEIASAAPIVDFSVDKLVLTTEEPLTDGNITLKIDTTLAENPSGNPIFDQILGGSQIIVRFKGILAL